MRNLYILLILTIILIITLLVFAFLFLEKEKHQTFFYSVEIGPERSGSVRIDRYKTEDKIIYKSTSFYPRALNRKIIHEKLVFDRKNFKLETFLKSCKNFAAATEAVYIATLKDGSFNFLSRYLSKSSAAGGIPHAEDTSVFSEESIVTYIPLIDKYNFARGGAQPFNCIYQALNLLPPARARVIFTSIRDEYIKVGRRKTKTEFFTVKSKALPKCYVWVSKKDRNIVQLKIESKSLLIKKTANFPKITTEGSPERSRGTTERSRDENKLYASHEVIFPSEGITLAGTLEVPHKEGKLPCVLLVAEDAPYDRENAGLYTDIGRSLAEGGNIVMRFDARGMGKSQGNNAEVSLDDTIRDIENALKFLLNQEKADKKKAFIVAHGSVCSYLSRLDLSGNRLRGIVMLGVARPVPILDFKCEYVLDKIRMLTEVDKTYPEILESSKERTLKTVKTTKKEYGVIQGKKVFLERMSELLQLTPFEGFRGIDTPLVIIYGKKDKFCPLSYVRDIEKNLNQAELRQFSTVSFRGLGHF
ncbi:MAG: alpha/beta hydrolase, partial [Candidatus Omnitrophota bacterium]